MPRDKTNPISLAALFREVRAQTLALARPLDAEDCLVQSMPDASPTKWHLAHTTWFFETFVLAPETLFRPEFPFLFNSYYNAVGERIARHQRGLVTRPTLREVLAYREAIDGRMLDLLEGDPPPDLLAVVELGLHHEQQHQELILTDIKHAFSTNPLRPTYVGRTRDGAVEPPPAGWTSFPSGVRSIGHAGTAFSFDNEGPRHKHYVEPFSLATRPVTNAEYLAFIDDDGYRQPKLWLSDGWAECQAQRWDAPLYWERRDDAWHSFTLAGTRPIDPAEPVCHVSFYEADAFARWSAARLPTEAEWEVAAADRPIEGNFLESGRFHPAPCRPSQAFGDVWEWTASPYLAYPGYRPAEGALGEYNGKFMCNQFVLRGGSCATPRSHVRPTYRNFFPPSARWQFTGLRLAR